MVDWDFILESVRWSKFFFEKQAQQYMNIAGYRENNYEPKIQQFNETINELTALKKIGIKISIENNGKEKQP